MRIRGHSMAPALSPGQLVFVNDRVLRFRPPRLGEIVAARPASLGGQALVKRVTEILGPDQFVLRGDQPDHSLDSRAFGPVSRRELLGPVRRLRPTQAHQEK
jgi:nickel-type superoxide dismutase maturation protease